MGNSVSNTANLLVDTALPTVTINTVAGDNVINAEVAAGRAISGTVNAEAGNTVTVTIGGNSHTATGAERSELVRSVPSDVLTALNPATAVMSVSATANGHSNTGTGERDRTIDANLPGLRVDTVAGDDDNTIEHNQNLIIAQRRLTPGHRTDRDRQRERLFRNGAGGRHRTRRFRRTVSTWPEGTVKISVTGDSTAGNPITISHDVTVDLATVAISINAIATDDVINAAESVRSGALWCHHQRGSRADRHPEHGRKICCAGRCRWQLDRYRASGGS